jgi:hypothetical protein
MHTLPARAVTKLDSIGYSTSAAGVAYAADGLHVFAVNHVGEVVHKIRRLDGTWSRWYLIGYGMRGRPAAATYQGKVYVFTLGPGDAVFYASGTDSTFARPQLLPGAQSLTSPSAASDANGLYVAGIDPTTQLAMMATFAGGNWGGWLSRSTDGLNAPASPVQVAANPEQPNSILYAAMTGQGRLTISQLFPSARQYTMREPVEAFVQGYPAFGIHSDGRSILVVRGENGALVYNIAGTSEWTGWAKWAEVR